MSDEREGRDWRDFFVGLCGVTMILFAILTIIYRAGTLDALNTLHDLSPMLLTGSPQWGPLRGGFSTNIQISLWAMAISLCLGFLLGTGLISRYGSIRLPSVLVMNTLRNSPWLVILYAMLYAVPYEIGIGRTTFEISPEVKAIIGLSLPTLANIAEVFRAGIQSIRAGQWEAARSLGYSSGQITRLVILPQALPLMLPNLMTTYAALFIGTSLVVVTGANDLLAVARVVIGSGAEKYATAIYIYILFVYFIFSFPIAIWTRRLERRVRAGK